MTETKRSTIERRDALANGQARYFTGRPCIAGHVAERDTIMGDCCECRNQRQNKRRLKQRLNLRKGAR